MRKQKVDPKLRKELAGLRKQYTSAKRAFRKLTINEDVVNIVGAKTIAKWLPKAEDLKAFADKLQVEDQIKTVKERMDDLREAAKSSLFDDTFSTRWNAWDAQQRGTAAKLMQDYGIMDIDEDMINDTLEFFAYYRKHFGSIKSDAAMDMIGSAMRSGIDIMSMPEKQAREVFKKQLNRFQALRNQDAQKLQSIMDEVISESYEDLEALTTALGLRFIQ